MGWTLEVTADFDDDGSEETLEYDVGLIQDVNDKGSIPFTGVATNRPENNVQFGFQGKTAEPDMTFFIYDDGSDKSNGTFSGEGLTDSNFTGDTVVTIEEQIHYLRQYIHSPIFGASWILYDNSGIYSDYDGDGSDEGTPIALQDVNIRRTAENPTRAEADIKLKVGGVV